MVIGTLEVEIILHDCHSLKDKRSIVKSIIDRVRNRFNVSVAEVDCLDLHQRSIIGIGVVSNDRRFANSILDQIADFIENINIAKVGEIKIEVS
jgi:uncharacterized protein YlxP (DUF503 family)